MVSEGSQKKQAKLPFPYYSSFKKENCVSSAGFNSLSTLCSHAEGHTGRHEDSRFMGEKICYVKKNAVAFIGTGSFID